MAAAEISIMSPIRINSTVLAVSSISMSTDVNEVAFRHSGNKFVTNIVKASSGPSVSFVTPFAAAYTLIGLDVLKVTTYNQYLQTFADGIKEATAPVLEFNTNAFGLAAITGIGEVDGIIMATVVVAFASADGTTHPLKRTDGATPATLASQPTLYVRGPVEIAGTKVSGVQSVSASTNARIISSILDGDTYPRTLTYDGGDRVITIGHSAPDALIAACGLGGVDASTTTKVFFRVVAADGATTGATGASITCSDGTAKVTGIEQTIGSADTAGLTITAASTTGALDPWTVSLSASIPAA